MDGDNGIHKKVKQMLKLNVALETLVLRMQSFSKTLLLRCANCTGNWQRLSFKIHLAFFLIFSRSTLCST